MTRCFLHLISSNLNGRNLKTKRRLSTTMSSLSGSPDVPLYKLEQDLMRAQKRISYLESSNEKSREREKSLYDDVLKSHRKAAKLEQDLLSANKKVNKTLTLLSEVENKRSKVQQEYFEACRKISRLEAVCDSYEEKESRLQKEVILSHEKLTNFELQILSSCKKITKLEASQEILEKKKNTLETELLRNQEKISELEASLTTVTRRNVTVSDQEMKQQFRRTELEARTKHLKSDNENIRRDLMTSRKALSVLETQLVTLLKERAQLNGKLNESARSVRKIEQENFRLQQEIEELSENLSIYTEKHRRVEEYQKLYEKCQQDSINEKLSLEETINVYKTELGRCQHELELERKQIRISVQESESKSVEINKTRQTAIECEKRLAECNREIERQRSLVEELEHEKRLPERGKLPSTVPLETEKCEICKADFEEKGISNEALAREKQTLELKLQEALNAVNNYREKYERSELEVERQKTFVGTVVEEREKAFVSCQSQLEYIESEYRLKYESCRESWQQEKSIRERLQCAKEEIESELLKFQSKYESLWEEFGIQQELNTALLSERENIEVKWQDLVTKYKRKYHECKGQLEWVRADNDFKSSAGTLRSKQVRHSSTDIERICSNANLQIRARVYDMEEPISSRVENGTVSSSEIVSNESLQYEVTLSTVNTKKMSDSTENGNNEIVEEDFEEDDANDVKSFIDSLREDLQESRAKNRALTLENKKFNIEVSTIRDKHVELQGRCNELTSTRDEKIRGLTEDVSAKEVEIEELRKKIEEEKNERCKLEAELETAHGDVSLGNAEELQRIVLEKDSANTDLLRDIEQLNNEKTELQQALTTVTSKNVDKVSELETSLREKESQVAEFKIKATAADSEKANLQQSLEDALAITNELKQDLKTAQEKNNELQQEIKLLQTQPVEMTTKEQGSLDKDTVEKKFFPSVYVQPDMEGLTDSQRLKKELEGGVKQYIEKMQKRVAELEEHNEKMEVELRQHKSEIDSSDFALRINAELKAKIESQDDSIAELRANNERFKIELKEKQSEIELANNAKDRKEKMIEMLEAKVADLEAKSKRFEQQPKEREEELERENIKLKAEVEQLQSKIADLEAQTRGLARLRTDSDKRAEVANIRKKLVEMDTELRKTPQKRVPIEMLYGPSVAVTQPTPPKVSETDGPGVRGEPPQVIRRNKPQIGQAPSHFRHSYAGGTYPKPFVPVPETKHQTAIPEQTTSPDDSVFHPPAESERRNSFQSDTSGESETSGSSEGVPSFLRRPVKPFRSGAKPFGVNTAPRPFYKSVDGKSLGETGSATSQNRRPQSWAEYNPQPAGEQQVCSSESSSLHSEPGPDKSLVDEQQLSESPVKSLHASPKQLPENWLEFSTEIENPESAPGQKQVEPASDSQEDNAEKSPVRVCKVKDFEEDSRDIIDENFSVSEAPCQSFTLPDELFSQPDNSPRERKIPNQEPKSARKVWTPPPKEVPQKAEKFNYKTYMKSTLQTSKTTREDSSYVTQPQTQPSPQGRDNLELVGNTSRTVKTFVLETQNEDNGEKQQKKATSLAEAADNSAEVTKRESVNSLVSQWNRRVSVNLDDI